jgi:hypothetical protein
VVVPQDELLLPDVSFHHSSVAVVYTLQEFRIPHVSKGDTALSSKDYDNAIELAIDTSNTTFASRCAAKLEKMLWEDALLDAQKVRRCLLSEAQWRYIGHRNKSVLLSWIQAEERSSPWGATL